MFTLPPIATSYFKKKLRFATLWGEIGMSGVLLLHKKVSIMENNETKKKERVYKLKFDQLWIDAINQIPVCYHSEIYYWLDYYQNHNHSDLIGTIKDDLVRSLFMLIYPTIRRRRLARERQRRYRARKKAARLASMAQPAASMSSQSLKDGNCDSTTAQSGKYDMKAADAVNVGRQSPVIGRESIRASVNYPADGYRSS